MNATPSPPAFPTASAADPSGANLGLHEGLARLRRRVRTLTLLAGVSRWVLCAVLLCAGWFVADVLLDLPLAVRRFVRLGVLGGAGSLGPWLRGGLGLLSLVAWFAAARRGRAIASVFAFAAAGVLGVLLWGLGRWVYVPLRVALPETDLALGVEERHRGLEERLAAALDFEQALRRGSRAESPAMMGAVVEQARKVTGDVSFARVASPARAFATAGLAILGLALAAGTAFAAPDTLALWLRRDVAGADVPWPRATTLVAVVRDATDAEVEKDPATPYAVTLGRSLVVRARARGRVPSEVEISDRLPPEAGGGEPVVRRMRPVAEGGGLFEHEFRDVRGDFTFTLRGGDDRDEVPSYAVVVRVPPKVLGLRADLDFPAYLARATSVVEGGTLDVPEGTRVRVSFGSDAPVAKVEAWVADEPVAVEGALGASGPFTFAFTAEKTVRYRLRIVTPDGRENDPGSDSYEVTARLDAPPRSSWIYPGAGVEATANARVPLFVESNDDHAISALRLEILLGGATDPIVRTLVARTQGDGSPPEAASPDGAAPAASPIRANDEPFGARTIRSYVPLEVRDLRTPDGEAPAAPMRLRLRVVAIDSRGQEGSGEWKAVDLLRGDEVERSLAGRRVALKADVAAALADLRAIEDSVQGLDAAFGDAERAALRDAQFRQGKVRGDVERAGRGVAALFNAYLYDRLGAEAPTDAILALFDRRHRERYSRAAGPPAGGPARSPESATPEVAPDPFPWSLYREVGDLRRERRLFDTGVVDKMVSVVDLVADTADVRAPAALAAAQAAASNPGAGTLRALREAQERLRDGLDSILHAMDEWQSLAELIFGLRRVIDEQEAIRGRIEGLEPK